MKRLVFQLWIFTLLLFAFTSNVSGQERLQVSEMVAENSRKLRQYSWTMRAETLIKKQARVALFKMRYDLNGHLQSTPMDGREKENISPDLLALGEAAFAYAQPRPNIMQAFMNRAEIWEGRGSSQGNVKIQGDGMMVSDDSVTMAVENEQIHKMEVRASLDGEPIFITVDYRKLPGGPTIVARLEALQPARNIELKIENFDYVSQVPSSSTTKPAQIKPAFSSNRKIEIPVGTGLRVRLGQPLSTKKNRRGQTFIAFLDQDITVDGLIVCTRDTRLQGKLVDVERASRGKGRAKLVLALTRIYIGNEVIPIETNWRTLEAKGTKKGAGERVIGGAGLGALIGAIADGKKGAKEGAKKGAAVAGLLVLINPGQEVAVSSEQRLTFRLELPLRIVLN